MNWLQDIISKFSAQGLAVVGLAYFRDIGKGGVRTVTITNRDGEVTPVALNEDYNGYIRAINNANYRLREAIDCTANLYDVEQDVAIVIWLDRKVNPNGVMQAIQQAVAGNDILNTSFDKQVILNEEGLPENDYIMMKVVVRMVSEYAGSSCPADVCAVYYDPCFEVPNRPIPPSPTGCTLQVGSGCCDYSVGGIDLISSNCFRVTFPNEFAYGEDGYMVQYFVYVTRPVDPSTSHTFFQLVYYELEKPTIAELISAIESSFDDDSGRYVLTTGSNWYQICDTQLGILGQIDGIVTGLFPDATENNIELYGLFNNHFIIQPDTLPELQGGFDFRFGIDNINTTSFQVLINDAWTDVTDEVQEGTWQRLNVCDDVITEWRIVDDEENVIDSGDVTATCEESTQVTDSACNWLQAHQTAIEELQNNPSGLTCETMQECEAFVEVKDKADTAVQPGDLATVATTGSYKDLSDKPAIPTLTSQLINDSGYQTSSQVTTAIAAKFQFFADLANTSVNTNTSNVVLGSVLIPGGTVPNNSLLEIETFISRLNGGASPAHRLCINTSNAFAGASQIALLSVLATAITSKGERTFICKTGQMRGHSSIQGNAIDDVANASSPTTTSVDWTVDQYILTVVRNVTGETTTHEATTVKVIKL